METVTPPEGAPTQESREERVNRYTKDLEKYLRPPYIWDLPPTGKKLMPGDPNYYRYMCRNNALGEPMVDIENLLADLDEQLDDTSRDHLRRAHDILWSFTRGHGRNKNRTEGHLAFIREAIEDAVKTLDEFLRAHEADKKGV